MRIVVALGGNALARRGQSISYEEQMRNVKIAMKSIAEAAKKDDIILVHGNGPQVGLLALQSEAYKEVPVYPLDVLSAESQGMIGYFLQQSLKNFLPVDRQVVTVLTQTLVSINDPAFKNPTKFIGPVYNKEQARELKNQYPAWHFKQDGDYWRRVVPSPKPLDIVEFDTVNNLIKQNVLTICVGGGGVPVTRDKNQQLQGVEAVVDKDAASELLASKLQADAFIIITDEKHVYIDFGKPNQRKLEKVAVSDLAKYDFAAGSMKPKVDAVMNFVRNIPTDKNDSSFAAIGSLDNITDMLQQKSGTIVKPE